MRSRRHQQTSARLQRALQRERDAQLVRREITHIQRTSALARSEVGDLTACAWLGLYDARRRFDPSLGYSFATFASARIRGAIYDGLAELGSIGVRGMRFIKRAHASGDPRLQRGGEHVHEQEHEGALSTRGVSQFLEDYQRLKSQIALSLLGYTSAVTVACDERRHNHQIQAPQSIYSTSTTSGRSSTSHIYDAHGIHDIHSTHNTYHTLHNTLCEARRSQCGAQREVRRADECEAPELRLIKREELDALREQVSHAFEMLSARDQEVLIATYDLKDIGDSAVLLAERAGIHRSTVARRRVVALANLRALLSDSGALMSHLTHEDAEVSRVSA